MQSLDDRPREMLTLSNPKLLKQAAKHGYLIAGLHLAPAELGGTGKSMCPFASPECRAMCLNFSGHGEIGQDFDNLQAGEKLNTVQAARVRRTRFLVNHPREAMAQIDREIGKYDRKATKQGLVLCIRPNTLSDRLWERERIGGFANLMEKWPNVIFYDYTKVPLRYRMRKPLPANYHLTFSRSETNEDQCADALSRGVNVAIPFNLPKGAPLPEVWTVDGVIARVIDGDESDLRFLDESGVIVGLRVKGHANKRKADESGFIVNV